LITKGLDDMTHAIHPPPDDAPHGEDAETREALQSDRPERRVELRGDKK
jgi:hypothetical protein